MATANSGTADADGSLAATLGALAVAFLLVTSLAGTIPGFNRTRVVPLGGFAGARRSRRRG